jgi:hypothetical protein
METGAILEQKNRLPQPGQAVVCGPIEMTVPGQTLLSTIRKLFWCIGQTLAGISSVAEILV